VHSVLDDASAEWFRDQALLLQRPRAKYQTGFCVGLWPSDLVYDFCSFAHPAGLFRIYWPWSIWE